MPIVVDASLVTVLATRDPRVGSVETRIRTWLDAGEELHAPMLLQYEVANALTRLIVAGRLTADDFAEAWQVVEGIPIHLHPLSDATRVVATAQRLGRASAYDAAYIVLAEQINAELWTLDGPLARNAGGLGFPVHLIQ